MQKKKTFNDHSNAITIGSGDVRHSPLKNKNGEKMRRNFCICRTNFCKFLQKFVVQQQSSITQHNNRSMQILK